MRAHHALVLLIAAACDSTEIRVCNESVHDFTSLEWGHSTMREPLAAGACTAYVAPEGDVYPYTYFRVFIGPDELTIQPIDFVGETPLDPGRWTYRLTIADYGDGRQLGFETVRD